MTKYNLSNKPSFISSRLGFRENLARVRANALPPIPEKPSVSQESARASLNSNGLVGTSSGRLIQSRVRRLISSPMTTNINPNAGSSASTPAGIGDSQPTTAERVPQPVQLQQQQRFPRYDAITPGAFRHSPGKNLRLDPIDVKSIYANRSPNTSHPLDSSTKNTNLSADNSGNQVPIAEATLVTNNSGHQIQIAEVSLVAFEEDRLRDGELIDLPIAKPIN